MRDEIVATLSAGYPFFIHFYHQINFGFESEMLLQPTSHTQKNEYTFQDGAFIIQVPSLQDKPKAPKKVNKT